ncbi:RHS repeat domain-containing protein [Desulfonema ishimotonii]|uniref:RHS repeat domain-containing protein n=1 Tax=Desulfonema ishimotonii TaxID=45657 RepID=UPI000F57631C|nr:RHS repeat-associated core domain-containing protein [Desulfonema ishimotonii]
MAAPAAVVDAEGRLYEYDPIGNRINSAGGTGPQVTYARNAVNQYTALTGGVNASPSYDDDGNMTGYDGATYTWNAENRLIAAETADKRITFLYDYMGRRVRKQVYSGTPGSWNAVPDETRVFVYDGWNLIRETVTAGASDSDTYYVWGLDLSQSVQGAGGIGGLLCSVSGGEVRQYTYDANGNVGQLVDEDGVIVAYYEYDPFGNEIRADGAGAQNNPFRFSAKYLDAETGLYYYGFRYYSAELGRWISRDPIGEKGGFNLYGFIRNNGINHFDLLGYTSCDTYDAVSDRYYKQYYSMQKEIRIYKERSIYPFFDKLREKEKALAQKIADNPDRYYGHLEFELDSERRAARFRLWQVFEMRKRQDRIIEKALKANREYVKCINENERRCWYCKKGTAYIGAGLALFGAHANLTIAGLPAGVVAWGAATANGLITITICEGSEKGVASSFLAGTGSLYLDYSGKGYEKEAKLAKKLGQISKHSALKRGAGVLLKLSTVTAYADVIINLGPVIKPDWFEFLN